MIINIIYFIVHCCVVLSAPIYPTSYVYRSDGSAYGYSKTTLSGKDSEYTNVIVKRHENPLTVSSYSTFIVHPQKNSDYEESPREDGMEEKHNSDNRHDWDKNVFYGSKQPPTYSEENAVNSEQNDENNNWSQNEENGEDVEKYVSRFFDEGLLEDETYFPDYWFGNKFYDDEFKEEIYWWNEMFFFSSADISKPKEIILICKMGF